MTIRGMNILGWIGATTVVALGCVQVSVRVGAERQRLETLDRQIAATRNEIKLLQAEFMTRANMTQLEKWNGQMMRLSVPRPDQILVGDQALARLEQPGGADQRQFAGYIVPDGAGAGDALAAAPTATAPVADVPRAATVAAADRPAKLDRSETQPVSVALTPARVARSAPRKPELRAASLDDKLLRDTSFAELLRPARGNAGKLQ